MHLTNHCGDLTFLHKSGSLASVWLILTDNVQIGLFRATMLWLWLTITVDIDVVRAWGEHFMYFTVPSSAYPQRSIG